MPTDTELLKFIMASMTPKPESAFRPYMTHWHLQIPGPCDLEEGPREALEAAYSKYRTQLAQAEQSPGNHF
jgi:hypothetical protein